MKTIEPIRVSGRDMWRMTRRGPRGGRVRHYCLRLPGQAEASAWQIWSPTARQAHSGDVAVGYDMR
jgi:hypothetical protein